MQEKKTYLTVEGRRKLLEELEFLRTTRRVEVAAQIKLAKEGGDVSENAGYDEAKNAQAFLEGRIMTIENMLTNAEIIHHSGPADTVQLGVFVTVKEDGEKTNDTYQIVGSAEASPAQGRISNESPMGKAMMGKKVGDRCSVKTPSGERKFQIVKIGWTPG
ncbi:MAG: transcription elongation factor GreA [Chloroflexi bacterium]|nr:transcription elongation factor GreA [Chloroflexota bacterium]MBI3733864.1 transcription elongation factor GreA [Chloroflexota bacterium]